MTSGLHDARANAGASRFTKPVLFARGFEREKAFLQIVLPIPDLCGLVRRDDRDYESDDSNDDGPSFSWS